MAAMYSPKLAQTRDGGFVGRRSSASQGHPTTGMPSAENIGSPSASRVLEGMLKTTTETGDIGLFSIRPSSIAQPIGPPRKIYHPPQPLFRHAQLRDYRWNIASNGQDASSDVLSVHDAASQKSVSQSSDMNHPHNRSNSATYSSSTVSNRRSYASLTRQMGDNGYIQRPRSPFGYPSSRAMRPPRPCFPALVDGEGSGYSPRPEVDRRLYEHGRDTLSPSPVYYSTRQRSPTPSFHQSGNWSAPSLLSKPLPHHRNSSPNLRRSSVPILNGWEHRSRLPPRSPHPVSVSPSRSNLSLSSAGDPQRDTPIQLPRRVPAKSRSGTPLYYDYSESFSPNDYPSPEILEQLPEPSLDKSLIDDCQVRVGYMEVEHPEDPAATHQSENVSSTQPLETTSCQSTVKESRQHSPDRHLQALSATNFHRNSGTKDVVSPDYASIQPPILGRGRHIPRVMDEAPSKYVISSSVGAIGRSGFTLDEASNKGQSSDHSSLLAAEDGGNGTVTVDGLSPLLDDKTCTTNTSHRSLSRTSSARSNGPSIIEDTNRHRDPLVPVVDNDVEEKRLSDDARSNTTIVDAISSCVSRQQRALCSNDQPHEANGIQSEHPPAMAHALSHKTELEYGGTSDLMGTAEPIQPQLHAHCSQSSAVDGCMQSQQLEKTASQHPDSPRTLEPAAKQDPPQYQKEEDLFGPSKSPRKLHSYLQISIPQHNGSLESSSLFSYEEGHPWACQNLDTDSGNELGDSDDQNLPRFRLKVTRPSDSILGTVRVNRTSVDSNPLAGLNLRDPRDLFTSSPKLDRIFRQSSEHLHPARATPGFYSQIERESKPVLGSISDQLSGHRPHSSELRASKSLATITNSLNPTDEQSFFSDDSSHMEGKRNLRKTLSNLRARVAIPHAPKNGAHSYDGAHSCDEISWRDEDSREASSLPARDAKALRVSAEVGRPSRQRRRVQTRRLRKKLSEWIREAGLVISSRVRPGLKRHWHGVDGNGSTALNC